MTRAEHMAWAKQRALEYAKRGDGTGCIASMISDLGKHPETANSVMIAGMTTMAVDLNDPAALKRWVEGFN